MTRFALIALVAIYFVTLPATAFVLWQFLDGCYDALYAVFGTTYGDCHRRDCPQGVTPNAYKPPMAVFSTVLATAGATFGVIIGMSSAWTWARQQDDRR